MSVRKSVFWGFAGQIASSVIAFSSTIITARLLSPHEMGIYAIAMATLGILQVIAVFGVSSYIVSVNEIKAETLASAFTVNALLALLLSSIVFTVSWAGGILLGDPAAGVILRVLCLGPLIGIFSLLPMAMMQREMQFKSLALINCGVVLTTSIFTVCSALSGASYMSPAYGAIAGAVSGAIFYNIFGRHHASFRVSLVGWRVMTKFGLQIVSIAGISALVGRVSEIALGRILGIGALGLYSRASGLSFMIFDNIYGTATRIVFTQMSMDYRERGDLKTTFLRGLQMIIAVMWPLLTGLAILARPFVHVLYGEKWEGAAAPLACLLIAQVLTLSYGMNWELFVLRGELGRQAKLEAVRLVIGLACFIVGCQFGLAGAAIGMIVASAVGVVMYIPHVHRLADTPHGALRRIYLQSGMLTFVAVAPCLILMTATGWTFTTPLLPIIGSVGLGVVLWLTLLSVLDHPLFVELKTLWRRMHGDTRSGPPVPEA